ncbi:MAG: hypothetical protein GY941_11390 [Planctomycetes bacterium]|nr:hypothetical protein [Planctomycetota bacterium]
MIILDIPLAGKDSKNKPFSCAPGESVTLDKKSEENLIKKGYAHRKAKK